MLISVPTHFGSRTMARVAAPVSAMTASSSRTRVRLQLARLGEDPHEALRHVESAFEMGLSRRDPVALGAALEILVSGIVRERFAPGTWRLVQLFGDRLAAAGFEAIAATAETALADLRR